MRNTEIKTVVKGIVLTMLLLLSIGIKPNNSYAGICAGGVPCVDSSDIIDLQIQAVDIKSGAINTSKIQNNAVTGAKVLDNTLTGADIQDGSIGSADIAAGAVLNTNIAAGAINGSSIASGTVDSSHIADGTVGSADVGFNYAGSASKGGPATSASDLTCVGCVSKAELDFVVPDVPSHRIVVAVSGGDYTSISAALAAINPDANNPYVIDVMPGTYTENITMKSYVHLRGAGRDVTTIQEADTNRILINNNYAITTISGFTIKGRFCILNNIGSSSTITDNTIIVNGGYGIRNSSTAPSSPIISGNIIKAGENWGIYSDGTAEPIIIDNTISGLGGGGGIYSATYSSATIKGNIITGLFRGITVVGYANTGINISYNRITNNTIDIWVSSPSTPNISFNTYDSITGDTGVGMYNVKSDGSPAPAP